MSHISTLKHIDVKDNDCATIEIDMDLKDPNSKVFLYKVRTNNKYVFHVSDGLHGAMALSSVCLITRCSLSCRMESWFPSPRNLGMS